ncbi:probable ATP-dependent RNA helicase DDX49 [Centruroides vittatus]|uniref:probable ATP-dependent RNA helicase DDX49 n=1 Tax=Centruroides vittatus TaxID=120091 RepID=UPI00350FA092
MTDFKQLKLNDWLIKQCNKMGLLSPTPVQLHCIPEILLGKDCIGCSKTGSGKTLAFAIPVLQKLSEDPYGIFALILTPTRELACQIADQFRVLGKPINLELCLIIGGMDMMKQGKELARHPHIVIATPGRLADHLESCNTFTLKSIKFLILDEADRLLEGQFNNQLNTIFNSLPKQKQTLLFSATITQNVQNMEKHLSNKFYWSQVEEISTVDQLEQFYVLMPALVRDPYLVHIIHRYLEKNQNNSLIIFTGSCKKCQILSMALTSLGFENVSLHSMKAQRERFISLSKFKSNKVKILVATDVASRGLDIPTVDMVINYNVPKPKTYIHRVGRTARAGRGGMAVTLVSQFDVDSVHKVENFINKKLSLYETKEKRVLDIMLQVSVATREAEIRLGETDFGERKIINQKKRKILEAENKKKPKDCVTKKSDKINNKQKKKRKKLLEN